MPHPSGNIIFDLKRKGTDGITGEVILPEGLTGKFTWNGKTITLRSKTKIDF